MIGSLEEQPRTRLRRLGDWYDRHRGVRSIVVSWLVTRTLSLLVLLAAERYITGDVFYYHRKLAALFDVGLGQTLNEYPTPVVWILLLPYGAGAGTRTGYLAGFLVFMLALDAVFTYALYRSAGRRHDRAVDFWVLFPPLVGALGYLRFDMLPAVLAGGALLAARTRPWVTGALTGLGAAIKLWPALLIPSFLAHKPDRRPAGIAFVVVGFGLAAVSLVAGGMTRLFSPLTWQSGRGLQIEAIWSIPLMAARALRPDAWVVRISRYQAYEIFGPGVELWVGVSNVATVIGLAVLAVLFVRAFRAGGGTPVAVAFLVLTTIAVMIVTNKTLSPQYLLWLGGPGAALLLLRHRATPAERPAIRHTAYALLALALLTHLVYPTLYNGLLGRTGPAMLVIATIVTAVRNLGLLAFTGYVVTRAWRFLGAGQRSTGDG
ncbi:MAG TPA: glycosyltransferase family 87 protein [Propionibacteriaceae bacterium]|jgi:hypothetical protein|nr:glycosyltransferase family 87 protein [Propionibacteriaceae bacterium]